MHLDEVAVPAVVAGENHARRAVRFVADDEVEVRQAVQLLGGGDDLYGLIRGEHDRHPVSRFRLKACGKSRGIGGCGRVEVLRLEFRHVVLASLPSPYFRI